MFANRKFITYIWFQQRMFIIIFMSLQLLSTFFSPLCGIEKQLVFYPMLKINAGANFSKLKQYIICFLHMLYTHGCHRYHVFFANSNISGDTTRTHPFQG